MTPSGPAEAHMGVGGSRQPDSEAGGARSRVAVVRCPDYRQENVDRAVSEAVTLALGAGWARSFRAPVLIKPNALSPRRPSDGVCTHPVVLRAAIDLLQAAGLGDISLGESSGGSGTHPRTATDRALEASGLAEVARERGVRLISFDREPAVSLPNPRGSTYQSLTLAKAAVEAGALVSISKFKTHSLTILTGAVKCLFGTVPGLAKRDYHWRNPSVQAFSQILVDIVTALRPALHLVDAVDAMEGNGPSAGPLRRLGLIVAGRDPVAVDAVLSAIIGLDPLRVPTTRLGAASGLGVAALERIDVVGVPLSEVGVKGFRLPAAARLMARMPESLTRWGISLLVTRPSFLKGRCKRCGVCVKECPSGALTLGKSVPELSDERCISCFCCHELCPNQAIRIRHRNPIVRTILRG